ncbi:23S rRNA pseudouridine2605 synthase [Dendrosporobacter quercicolus]|uniref:Pseudouridine synthase n=1 Tax=Dendrosporobacter quercicolus TaxID=146817 RepID=A0A1G9L3K9_9FIRM|nr:pseudouridine synthase [Dendrosporobacter quercicolus]SDL56444.1 23S rRNA pseudouridine2605 synthase [Dendrosporobacter quercicolus]
MLERLQKVISQAGIASRREAEELIKAGRVTVNGAVVTELGTKVFPGKDRVAVDGKRLTTEEHVYLMLNKPKGVITTVKDPGKRQTVIDYLKDIPQRIYPVGRLDFNTEGLLLLTNDGALTNSLIHPSHKVFKTYLAKVKGIPPEEKLDLLRIGIKLEDGITAPAQLYIVAVDQVKNSATLEITIHEGKNRQIRRMCEAIGYPIRQLKRTKFAGLTLNGLRRGQYRHLSEDEVELLQNLAVKK